MKTASIRSFSKRPATPRPGDGCTWKTTVTRLNYPRRYCKNSLLLVAIIPIKADASQNRREKQKTHSHRCGRIPRVKPRPMRLCVHAMCIGVHRSKCEEDRIKSCQSIRPKDSGRPPASCVNGELRLGSLNDNMEIGTVRCRQTQWSATTESPMHVQNGTCARPRVWPGGPSRCAGSFAPLGQKPPGHSGGPFLEGHCQLTARCRLQTNPQP